ncbi:MAG: tRNA1Val (adenine37-N6)-methyltransferase [Bacteroidia bacterium]|jgi:tRNA1Val (adenine37-N6)-methyltransferase
MGTNNIFKFKEFDVRHSNSAMKVGTDAVLLGSWAKSLGPKKILDIGSGTGLLALMLAQRFPHSQIVAIEPNSNSCIDASYNFENSKFHERIKLKSIMIQEYQTNEKFDLIISNPPFFKNALAANNNSRSMARHDLSLTFQELIENVINLLSPFGQFALIIPKERCNEMQSLAINLGLKLSRIMEISGKEGGQAKRCLHQYGFQPSEVKVETMAIEIERHLYTQEYIELTRNFYLKM